MVPQVVISNRKKRKSTERQLTEADFLNPKLGDQFVQGSKHYEDVYNWPQKLDHMLRWKRVTINPHVEVKNAEKAQAVQ